MEEMCKILICGVVCDNHSSNVSAYTKVLARSFIKFKESRMYLLFDMFNSSKTLKTIC